MPTQKYSSETIMKLLVATETLRVIHNTTAPEKMLSSLCCVMFMPSGVGSSHTNRATATATIVPYFLPYSSNLLAMETSSLAGKRAATDRA